VPELPDDILELDPERCALLVAYLEAQDDVLRLGEQRLFFRIFPDDDIWGPDPKNPGELKVIFHRRQLYPRHMEFFWAGSQVPQRCFMAANRVGKTRAGAFEMTCHLTGLYPDWWEGKRFDVPITAIAAGKTFETTRDIVQAELFGPVDVDGARKSVMGTGMIPAHLIGRMTWASGGVPDVLDTVKIKHVSGRWSTLSFKAYKQGRGIFEGVARHFIWFDEEPPADVWGEALIRTATTDGAAIITFTPLEGISTVVQGFMPEELMLEDDDSIYASEDDALWDAMFPAPEDDEELAA
jgi:phage terminase large subunit-like protein